MYKRHIKRFLDFVISIIMLLCISWILIIVMLSLCIVNKGVTNIFFCQDRPGKDGKIFKIIKFKTMTDECDNNGMSLPDEQRLTKIGKFIRSTSIDELPQLINVLKGDMSLIGPRPLLVQYLPLYNKVQFRRHEVRPGISGWAQCNGRNTISWERKFELDVWYVDNCSFLLDIKIVFLSIKKVLTCMGINQKGNATIEYFKGNI